MTTGGSVFGPIDQNVEATIAANGSPAFTGVAYNTSSSAKCIPIMWGTRRLGTNIIWQADIFNGLFTAANTATYLDTLSGGNGYALVPYDIVYGQVIVKHLTLGGETPYGSSDQGNSGASYWEPAIMALCEGPINAVVTTPPQPIQRIWNGSGNAAVAWPLISGQNYDPASIFYYQIIGTQGQAEWSYWTWPQNSGLAAQALAYTCTAYIASPQFDYGHDFKPPNQQFDVTRTPNPAFRHIDSYSINYDYAPAEIIIDILTSVQYGYGLLTSVYDTTSFVNYADYAGAQGLFFSVLLDAQVTGVDLIDRLAVESNTWIFWSGTAIMAVPLGDEGLVENGFTYTPDQSPAYNLTTADIMPPGITVNRADPIDCHNRVRLEYCDRSNNYSKNIVEWKDTTLINQYGILDESSIDGSDICDVAVAAISIELYGKRMAYVRNLYSFTLNARYILLLPGSIVTLTDNNLAMFEVPVRIRTIEEDDGGNLQIVAEEYPGVLGISRAQTVQGWSPSMGAGGGSSSTPSGGSGLTPTPTSGGVLVMTSAMTLVLYVAGDVITLPPSMPVGVAFNFKHDQARVPQPTPAILEDNPVTFQQAVGATTTIENPQDGTLAYGATATLVVSGGAQTIVNIGDGTIRWID